MRIIDYRHECVQKPVSYLGDSKLHRNHAMRITNPTINIKILKPYTASKEINKKNYLFSTEENQHLRQLET